MGVNFDCIFSTSPVQLSNIFVIFQLIFIKKTTLFLAFYIKDP